jgi:hypothetical protein
VYNYNQCRYVIYGDKSHIDIVIDMEWCHWQKIDRLKWEPAPPPKPIHDRVVIITEESARARRAHRV